MRAGSRMNTSQGSSSSQFSEQIGSRAPGLQPVSRQSMSPSMSSSRPLLQSSNVPAITGGSQSSSPVFSPSPQTQVEKSCTHMSVASLHESVVQTSGSPQGTGMPAEQPTPSVQT